MLTPEQQKASMAAGPQAFSPAAGAWGRAGSTVVRLKDAGAEPVGEAMTAAWQNAVSKLAAKKTAHPRAERPLDDLIPHMRRTLALTLINL